MLTQLRLRLHLTDVLDGLPSDGRDSTVVGRKGDERSAERRLWISHAAYRPIKDGSPNLTP